MVVPNVDVAELKRHGPVLATQGTLTIHEQCDKDAQNKLAYYRQCGERIQAECGDDCQQLLDSIDTIFRGAVVRHSVYLRARIVWYREVTAFICSTREATLVLLDSHEYAVSNSIREFQLDLDGLLRGCGTRLPRG